MISTVSINVTVMIAAVIVALSTTASALIVGTMTNRQRRREVDTEHRHREAVAESSSRQTHSLIGTIERIAARTENAGHVVDEKLDVIHTLVNSGLTAAKESERDALVRELATMREMAALHKLAGEPPSEETVAAIGATERRLSELQSELSLRHDAEAIAHKRTEEIKAREHGG